MKRLLNSLGAVALAFAAGGAQAIPLTDLLAGGSITAGDKLFDSWEVLFEDTSDFHSVNTDNIDVVALNDGGLDPGPGLQFDILNGEFNVTGDDIYAYIDFMFGFRVSVLDPSLAIVDASLGGYDAGTSRVPDGSNDIGSYILETVGTAPGLDDLGVMSVEHSVLDEVLTSVVSDSTSFAPQDELWVTKNLYVWAVDSTDSARLSGFSQRFSQQTVPEPATLLLMAAGVAGLGFNRRRGKRAAA